MITDISGLMNPFKWLLEIINGGKDGDSDSGVTAGNAITYAPVYYGVRKISSHIGMLPCNLLLETEEETSVQRDHPSYSLMRRRPNGYQTPSQWKQQLMTHAILWGNGRSFIYRVNNRPKELLPLMPDRTITYLVDGEKFHVSKPVRDDRIDLLTDLRDNPNDSIVVSDEDVIHIPGFSFDGVEGKSLIQMASQSWGIGKSAESRSLKQLSKGYAGGLMLEAPAGVFRREEDAKEFLENFRKQHDGDSNAGKTGLLREGIKANVLQMSNSDAQFLEQRKFQRQEAALWLMLEQILGDDSSVSYNSLEQKNLAYLMNCLGPWLTTIEEELNAKLLNERERKTGYYFKFNDGALLRSDKQAAMNFAVSGVSAMILTRNEAREMFDLNPVEGGDDFMNPSITPGTASQMNDQIQQDQETDEPASENDDDEDETSPLYGNNDPANRVLIETIVKDLIKVEANRVKTASKKPDFVAKIERFYGSWESKFANKLEEMGLDRGLATEHCTESKLALLAIAEKNHPKDVANRVERAVSSWPNRVFQLLSKDKS